MWCSQQNVWILYGSGSRKEDRTQNKRVKACLPFPISSVGGPDQPPWWWWGWGGRLGVGCSFVSQKPPFKGSACPPMPEDVLRGLSLFWNPVLFVPKCPQSWSLSHASCQSEVIWALHMESSFCCVINGKQTLEADDPGPYLYESICLCFVYDSLSYSTHRNLGLFTLTFPRIWATWYRSQ